MKKLLTVALMTGLLVGTVGGTTTIGQDLTTLLTRFLNELYAGYLLAGSTVNTGAPDAGNCDAAGETNRLYWDSTNDAFYACSGASGWVTVGGGSFPITAPNAGALRTGTTANDTLLLQAYDVDGTAYTTLLTLTAGNTPSMTGLFGAGSAAAPSVAIGVSNLGWYWVGAGVAGLATNGTLVGKMESGVWYTYAGLNIGNGGIDNLPTKLASETTATLQLGLDANGAAVAQTLKAHDGITGTDIAGANLILAGGRGTGAGASGNLIFQVAPIGSTGTTAQVLATALDIRSLGANNIPTMQVYGGVLFTENFHSPHIECETDFTAKVLTDGGVNYVLSSHIGAITYREEVAKTVSSWKDTGGALDIDADVTNDEGVEIVIGDAAAAGADGWITTRAASPDGSGCFEVNITLGDNAGTDQLLIGWRSTEAWDGANAYANYVDWSVVGINNVDGSIFSLGEVNSGGTLSDDSGVNWADGETRTLKSCIAATTGVPTAFYTAAGSSTYSAITMTNSGTAKTTTIQMFPFITYMNAAGADPNIRINWMRVTR